MCSDKNSRVWFKVPQGCKPIFLAIYNTLVVFVLKTRPVLALGHSRISPPRFLAESCKRQLNQGSFVLLYFKLFTFLICIEFVYLYFPVLFCLSVSVK